ncbi:Juvenile hormone binding protein, partial [Operophtera brumata]
MGNGIPEYNIPPIDPYHVKNIKVSILELVDIIFDGQYKLFSKSPLINNLFGGESIHGDGDAKVKL